MVGLGDLEGSGLESRAEGVSDDGLVVVGWSRKTVGTETFQWTSGDGMVGLGDLPGGGSSSNARAVSADGSVVVGSGHSETSLFEAYRWMSGGGMISLGALPAGVNFSQAFGVSGDGSVVVGEIKDDSDTEAFRWTSGDGFVAMGDLPGLDLRSRANDTSADGSVIVGFGWTNLGFEAFYWDDTNGMQNLKTVLEVQLGLDLTGWSLREATSVSSDGTTIVGNGTNPDGFTEAFIAVIPGPGVCPGDIVGLDGTVNVSDLLSLLGGWGSNPGHPADTNEDGIVNVSDLLTVLGAWGVCP